MRLLKAELLLAQLLGLDVGSNYVGLAVSDEQNRIALPLRLQSTPLQGSLGAMHSACKAVQVRLLVGELCKTGKLDDLSYTYWDENFTSECAEALLDPLNLHNPVETKTMTVDIIIMEGLQLIQLKSCLVTLRMILCAQGYLDNMNRELRSADNSEE